MMRLQATLPINQLSARNSAHATISGRACSEKNVRALKQCVNSCAARALCSCAMALTCQMIDAARSRRAQPPTVGCCAARRAAITLVIVLAAALSTWLELLQHDNSRSLGKDWTGLLPAGDKILQGMSDAKRQGPRQQLSGT